MRVRPRRWALCLFLFTFPLVALSAFPGAFSAPRQTQPPAAYKYDLLLRNGHVIDPRNRVSEIRDVAIFAGPHCLATVRHTAIFRIAPRVA